MTLRDHAVADGRPVPGASGCRGPTARSWSPRAHRARSRSPAGCSTGLGEPVPDALVETWQADPDSAVRPSGRPARAPPRRRRRDSVASAGARPTRDGRLPHRDGAGPGRCRARRRHRGAAPGRLGLRQRAARPGGHAGSTSPTRPGQRRRPGLVGDRGAREPARRCSPSPSGQRRRVPASTSGCGASARPSSSMSSRRLEPAVPAWASTVSQLAGRPARRARARARQLARHLAGGLGAAGARLRRALPAAAGTSCQVTAASPAPPGPYTIAQLGGGVLALLDAHGIDRAAYCGISLGGMIGMWLAAHSPERITALGLDLHLGLPAAGARAGWPGPTWSAQAGMASVGEPSIGRWFTPAFVRREPGVAAAFAADLERTRPGRLRRLLRRDRRDGPAARTSASISAPTMVIAGAARSVDAAGARRADRRPGGGGARLRSSAAPPTWRTSAAPAG